MEELTAYHEAGHALMAVKLGIKVEQITIEPDNDDGPQRFGDVQLSWNMASTDDEHYLKSVIMVCLSGPVAEMIYSGDPYHPGFVPEWSQDWKHAWSAAASFFPDKQDRLRFLEQTTMELHHYLSRNAIWAAIAGISDELLAHETIEGEQVEDVVRFWLRNG